MQVHYECTTAAFRNISAYYKCAHNLTNMINLVQKSCIFNRNDPSDCTLSIRINVSLGKQLSWSSTFTQRLILRCQKGGVHWDLFWSTNADLAFGFLIYNSAIRISECQVLEYGAEGGPLCVRSVQHVPVAARSSRRVCKLRSRAKYGGSSHILMCVVVMVIVVVAAEVVVKKL